MFIWLLYKIIDIITLHIFNFQVQDSKSIQTWTLQQGHIHYFTTPAAYFKERLYSVMDDTVSFPAFKIK